MRIVVRIGILAAAVAGVFGAAMALFTPEQRTLSTARFMASYKNSAPQIVIGVLSEYSLPFLHASGFIRPMDMDLGRGIRMHLDARDLVPRTILANGVYEPVTTKLLEDHLPVGGTFVDIGAHIGLHSLLAAAKVGPQGRVISVEPNPDTLVELRRNLDLSQAKQVAVQPVACSDKEGKLELFAGSMANTGMSSLSKKTAEAEGESGRRFAVRARPLDDIAAETGLTRIDAMKIDVEGAELFVLKGAMRTLERFHPFLVMEVKEDQLAAMGTTKAAVLSLLQDLGYTPGRSFEGNVEFVYGSKLSSQQTR